ncbi:DUF4168 domain-containing protein [Psychroflexus aestuariivivens]|uniref:DUF4168 domain-containing protein n=1 Tax=Psychroflexus aestuariivivens TaxID=1795040 RepID=UPI000FD7CA56|nr:DUF4168 domain-containing protein [Psychroflexus aestuariivivens]
MKKSILTAGIFLIGIFSTLAQTEAKVSDAELEKFANAYLVLQQENQKIQQEMVSAIEEEGLTATRFNEIYQAKNNPNSEPDLTEKEAMQHKAAMEQIEKIQANNQAKMEKKIKEEGMTIERYQEIGAKLQQSPELQQKLQAMMMKKQGGGQGQMQRGQPQGR